jgi:hypothetical protein
MGQRPRCAQLGSFDRQINHFYILKALQEVCLKNPSTAARRAASNGKHRKNHRETVGWYPTGYQEVCVLSMLQWSGALAAQRQEESLKSKG